MSPEELKKRIKIDRMLEYIMKKKEVRERRYEKAYFFILSIVMVIMIIIALNAQFKKGVEECVNAGHDRTFCEVGLS
ncbi:MAG: hypothetical protein L6V81_11090 [Clostridium sp.]|nr:MAG: hypothetical protein L6V81_11090 [Clostridium sp.]